MNGSFRVYSKESEMKTVITKYTHILYGYIYIGVVTFGGQCNMMLTGLHI